MRDHIREYWLMYLVTTFAISVLASIIVDKVLLGIAAGTIFYIVCFIDRSVRRHRRYR